MTASSHEIQHPDSGETPFAKTETKQCGTADNKLLSLGYKHLFSYSCLLCILCVHINS